MFDVGKVKDLAKHTLTVTTSENTHDHSLWHRAQRVKRNIDCIINLPELIHDTSHIDYHCLITAALFSDAGLANCFDTQQETLKSLMSNTNIELLLDTTVQIISRKLAGIVDNVKIEKINRIITESNNRKTNMTEAVILSDARNLDDMGAVGIFKEFGYYAKSGKSTDDILKMWKRKTDYKYWQARLKDGFRFEPVRKIAQKRLLTADSFMNQLNIENSALDIDQSIDNSSPAKKHTHRTRLTRSVTD